MFPYYLFLWSVEFVREISQLPTPPEVLRADLYNNWRYDEDNIFSRKVGDDFIPLYFLTELQDSEIQELKRFESRCKELLYEGVTVQRIASSEAGRENDTIERRTLFLMLPEVGSLRLGFLSKSSMSHLNSEIDSLPSKGVSSTLYYFLFLIGSSTWCILLTSLVWFKLHFSKMILSMVTCLKNCQSIYLMSYP